MITRDVVIVKDVAKTLDWVANHGGLLKENIVFSVNIDSGGGSLKVLGSIFHDNEDLEIMFTRFEQPGQRPTGVNRLILLAHVEDLQETWHNLWILLEFL